MKQIFIFTFCLMLSVLVSNQMTAQSETDVSSCDAEAKVLDYTGLDGCRFLLELKDGTRLLPVSLSNTAFKFSEGQIIKIKYTILKDVATSCMTAAVAADISCITELKAGTKPGQLFNRRVCADTEAPLKFAWVKKLVLRNNIAEIKRGYREDEPYYIMYGDTHVQTFSCTGEMVCEFARKEKNSACEAKMNQLKDIQSVWAQK